MESHLENGVIPAVLRISLAFGRADVGHHPIGVMKHFAAEARVVAGAEPLTVGIIDNEATVVIPTDHHDVA